ncbi:methyltransferase family protein [Sphingomonas canadensis]|uniref:Methyltransferase family protein n=1 Tax=Sphingomonas canadensis TaxID=1219257 RepID=A0ABW3H8A9_9SPHN|nr:isoprenylcysteine carboxylmethyltransferase family protein [Sphingomonas canadensis]MCW3836087.1 isoprenylcysteine carboxylmethyltransferase family protein [Sphingomonas canadensis]
MQIDKDSAGVRFPPPLMFLGALGAGMLLDALIGRWGLPFGNYLEHSAGWVLLVGGAAVLLSAAGLFRRAGTRLEPWKTSSALITDGVYRWTRNPMYLGMAAAYLGIALILDSLTVALLLVPLVLAVEREVIAREEGYMEAKFGDAYRAYKASVRRWF